MADWIDDLVDEQLRHRRCEPWRYIFCVKNDGDAAEWGEAAHWNPEPGWGR